MSAVTIQQQVDRVTRRLATVEHCLDHCRHEERPTIEREKLEWEAVLATLLVYQIYLKKAQEEAAGFLAKSAAPQGAMPLAVTSDPLPSDQTALRLLP